MGKFSDRFTNENRKISEAHPFLGLVGERLPKRDVVQWARVSIFLTASLLTQFQVSGVSIGATLLGMGAGSYVGKALRLTTHRSFPACTLEQHYNVVGWPSLADLFSREQGLQEDPGESGVAWTISYALLEVVRVTLLLTALSHAGQAVRLAALLSPFPGWAVAIVGSGAPVWAGLALLSWLSGEFPGDAAARGSRLAAIVAGPLLMLFSTIETISWLSTGPSYEELTPNDLGVILPVLSRPIVEFVPPTALWLVFHFWGVGLSIWLGFLATCLPAAATLPPLRAAPMLLPGPLSAVMLLAGIFQAVVVAIHMSDHSAAPGFVRIAFDSAAVLLGLLVLLPRFDQLGIPAVLGGASARIALARSYTGGRLSMADVGLGASFLPQSTRDTLSDDALADAGGTMRRRRGPGLGEEDASPSWTSSPSASASSPRPSWRQRAPNGAALWLDVLMRNVQQFISETVSNPRTRSIFVFLCLNMLFMSVEMAYGFWTNSLGLVSDAFHMLFDSTALLIGLYAVVPSRWPRTLRYSFGYARFETLAAYTNAVFLVVIACSILVEAFWRFIDPPEISTSSLLVVSVLGLLVNLVGLFAFGEHGHSHGGASHSSEHSSEHSEHSHSEHGHSSHDHSHSSHGHSHSSHGHSHSSHGHGGGENFLALYLHVMADTMGSVGVIISTLIIMATGWTVADPICSTILAALILLSIIPLVRTSGSTLMQAAPADVDAAQQNAVRQIALIPGVTAVFDARAWRHSDDAAVFRARVQVSDDVDELDMTESIQASLALSEAFSHATVQVEKAGFDVLRREAIGLQFSPLM